MKITDVETILLSAPRTCDPYSNDRQMRSAAVVEIHTDVGVSGIGEPYAGYFVPELIPPVVEFYKPVLIGADPDNIPTLVNRMFHAGQFWGRLGLGASVLSGLEMALWDLKGKINEVPTFRLLGGPCHEGLFCYATGGPSIWPQDELIRKIEDYRSLGFTAAKVSTGWWDGSQEVDRPQSIQQAVQQEVEKLDCLRRHFGDNFHLMLDGHMDNMPEDAFQWDELVAQEVLPALERFGLLFFEEPLPYTDPFAYARLRRRTTVLIAGGECLVTAAEFRQWLELEAFGLPQLDASFMGGIGEFLKVAKFCEVLGLSVAVHSASAAPGAAANLHAALATPNIRIFEYSPYNSLQNELWVEPPEVRNGYLHISDAPGLGVRLTDEIKNKYRFQPGSGEFNSVRGKMLTT